MHLFSKKGAFSVPLNLKAIIAQLRSLNLFLEEHYNPHFQVTDKGKKDKESNQARTNGSNLLNHCIKVLYKSIIINRSKMKPGSISVHSPLLNVIWFMAALRSAKHFCQLLQTGFITAA